MTAGTAVRQMMQQLRGIVAELNKRDEAVIALRAQETLAAAATLEDALLSWELQDLPFAPIKSDEDLAPPPATPIRKPARRA